MKWFKIFSILFLLLLLVQLVAASPADNNSELIPPLDILWEHELNSDINAITASNDSFFVAADKIYCIEPYTGKIVWQQDFSSHSIYYDEGSVYVIDENKKELNVLNAADGRLEWLYRINDSEGTVESDTDRIYIKTKFNFNFFVLNKITGESIYELTDTSRSVQDFIVSDTDIVLITYENNKRNIQFLNLSDFVSTFTATSEIYLYLNYPKSYSHLVQGSFFFWDINGNDTDSIYIGYPDKIKSITLDDNILKWEFKLQTPKQILAFNESVYIVSNEIVYCLDSKSGNLNWIFKTDDTYKLFNTTIHKFTDSFYYIDKIISIDDNLFIVSENNVLYRINQNGEIIWKIRIDSIYKSSTFVNGFLYIVDLQDNLYIVDMSNGKIIQKMDSITYFTPAAANSIMILGHEHKLKTISSLKIEIPTDERTLISMEKLIESKNNHALLLLILCSIFILIGAVLYRQEKLNYLLSMEPKKRIIMLILVLVVVFQVLSLVTVDKEVTQIPLSMFTVICFAFAFYKVGYFYFFVPSFDVKMTKILNSFFFVMLCFALIYLLFIFLSNIIAYDLLYYMTYMEPSHLLHNAIWLLTETLIDVIPSFILILPYITAVLFLLLFLFIIYCLYIIVQLNRIGTVALKIRESEKHGDYKKAIEYYNNLLLSLTNVRYPFFGGDLHNTNILSSVASSYYMLGDLDNCIQYLKRIVKIDEQISRKLYSGKIDLSKVIDTNPHPLLLDNSLLFKYFKLKSYFKNRINIDIELIIVFSLILSFAYIATRILNGDYLAIRILNGNYLANSFWNYYLSSTQLTILIGMLFFYIVSPILLLLIVRKIEKYYLDGELSYFLAMPSLTDIYNEKKIRYVYFLINIALILTCIFFAIQITNWMWFSIPYISVILNYKIIGVIYCIYAICFIFSLLLLSFSIDFFNIITYKAGILFPDVESFGLTSYFLKMPIVIALAAVAFLISSIMGFFEGFDFYFQNSIVLLLTIIVISIPFWISYYWKLSLISSKVVGDFNFKDRNYVEAKEKYEEINCILNNRIISTIINRQSPFFVNFYLSLGECSYQLNKKKKACAYFKKSLDYAEKSNITSDKWQVYFKIGKIKEDFTELNEAYEYYKKAIVNIEDLRELVKLPERKEVFFENKAEVYSRMILLCLKLGKDFEAFEFAEKAKGRVFLDLLGTAKIELKVDSRSLERKEELLKKIRELQSKLGERRSVERNTSKLNELLQKYDRLLLEIKEKDPEYYSLNKIEVLDIAEIQQMLQEDEVLLEFFTGEKIIVFLIMKNSFEAIELSFSMQELSGKISDFRSMIDNEVSLEKIKRLSRELYDELISPLESFIENKGLLIVPHRSLHYLPFNALFDGQKWMLEKHRIRFLQSASILKFLNKNKERMDSILVMGNPTEDLPSSEMEARKIAEIFNAEPYLGKDATKESAINMSKDKDVIHLACHGSFEAGVPRFSRLLLADENLFVNEIYNLDLDASLVTLSACQTGLGSLTNGDEVEGMTRAFMRAGSPSVISSLWNVDDESTEILFSNFYQLKGNKMDRLRKAQLRLMEDYEHPLYWAPFVIFGDK